MSNEQILTSRPTFPAQLNMAHPLARGLVGAWVMNEQDGLRVWDSSPSKAHGTISGFTHKRATHGLIFDGSAAFVNMGSALSSNLNLTAITIMSFIKLTAATGQYDVILNTDNDRYELYFPTLGQNIPTLYVTATAGVSTNGATALNLNQIYCISCSYDQFTGGRMYINGVLDGTAAANGAISGAPTALSLGGTSGSSYTMPHYNYGVWIWNRFMTPAQHSRIYLEPYSMFL